MLDEADGNGQMGEYEAAQYRRIVDRAESDEVTGLGAAFLLHALHDAKRHSALSSQLSASCASWDKRFSRLMIALAALGALVLFTVLQNALIMRAPSQTNIVGGSGNTSSQDNTAASTPTINAEANLK
jgi:hypothetical protein